jgi:hypothetical protein
LISNEQRYSKTFLKKLKKRQRRGQRPLALPVKWPSATPRLELSPQFKLKGVANEPVSEIISHVI